MATLTGGNASGSLIADTGTPSAGDIIIVREGAANYTSGLDFSAVELASFKVLSSYTGTIGSNGTALQLDLANSAQSPGLFEYNSAGNAAYVAPTSEIQTARIYNTGPTGLFFTDGTVTSLEVAGGRVSANDQTDVIAAVMTAGQLFLSTHSSQAVDTLTVYGGNCTCERDIGTATVHGALTVNDSSVTPTTVNVGPGGTFRHIGGNIGTLTAEPGSTVDFSGLSDDITITTANRYPGVNYIPPPQGITVTVSTPNEFLGAGTFAT